MPEMQGKGGVMALEKEGSLWVAYCDFCDREAISEPKEKKSDFIAAVVSMGWSVKDKIKCDECKGK